MVRSGYLDHSPCTPQTSALHDLDVDPVDGISKRGDVLLGCARLVRDHRQAGLLAYEPQAGDVLARARLLNELDPERCELSQPRNSLGG